MTPEEKLEVQHLLDAHERTIDICRASARTAHDLARQRADGRRAGAHDRRSGTRPGRSREDRDRDWPAEGCVVTELFLAFLAQHDDARWLRVVDRLQPAIHPVDRVATRIWLHFYPL